MFKAISALLPTDPDYPPRARTLDIRHRVLMGTLYDLIEYEFHQEVSGSDEYIPLQKRAPSVRYGLCRLVVDETTAMLFGEGRFPVLACEDEATRDALATISGDCGLVRAMREAALLGSCGSVAILMRMLSDRPYFSVMRTDYLTPVWKPAAPDQLQMVREQYKVRGRQLFALGYDVPNDDTEWWVRRDWSETEEIWYLPLSKTDQADGKPFLRDAGRTVIHSLGFVPMVWMRNLPGGDDVDGCCTFALAIETGIEIDYLLSQGARGLKYASDPKLVISSDGELPPISGGSSQALVLGEAGKATLLEIDGTAANTIIEYVRALREMALETIHGNRTSSDKISGAQSGRAMEMMHQALINLVDQLRDSYGTNGLLPLARMVVAAGATRTIKVFGADLAFKVGERVTLQWPPYFQMTQSDMQEEASTLSTLRTAGLISQESGVKIVCETQDIADLAAEMARIKADETAADARLAKQAAMTQAKENVPG